MKTAGAVIQCLRCSLQGAKTVHSPGRAVFPPRIAICAWQDISGVTSPCLVNAQEAESCEDSVRSS